ncbi:hypothetical protein QZH41_016585 [Actinostola sp. cb2023]|nr:hypothetical protein QZH41_016585 [Actinostola sp. cb2023]
MYSGPAGFEDFSDDDEFDFGDGGSFHSSRSFSAPKQPSSTGAEYVQKQFKNQTEDNAVKPSVGRGRGRGGFPRTGPKGFDADGGGRDQKSPFSKRAHKKSTPTKPKDPGPNPIILDDLKVAAIKGSSETVAKLLDQGIAIDIVLPSGWTTLMHAARVASDEVIELLLKRGANANYQKDMFTVLMAVCDCDSAVEEGNVLHCVELLLEHGAKTGVYDRHRMSPLIYAARQGRVTVCERLLEKGAQINKTDGRGWTIAGILEDAAAGNLGKRADMILSSSEEDKVTDDSPSLERYGELEVLLCGIQLGYLVPKFQEHKITFEGFAKMIDKDFDQIGITQVGVRQKILDAIRDIHVKEWDMSSLQRQKNLLSAPEVTTVIANVSKHLSIIESSVVYAHKQLEGVTNPTEFVQDVAEAEGLIFFAKEALKNSESLRDEVVSLQRRCNELSSQTKLLSADLISHQANPTNSTSRRGLLIIGFAAVALGIMYIKKAGIQLTSSS